MRVPSNHRLPTWQRFFAGTAIGAIISWFVFLFIFGVIQEKHRTIIDEQKLIIQDLENNIKIYQEEYTKLNKEAKHQMTVQSIDVHVTNGEKFLFQKFRIKNIEEEIKEELSDLLAKDMESVYSNYKLIEKTIENKRFKFEGKEYQLEMTKLMLFTTISIELELSLSK